MFEFQVLFNIIKTIYDLKKTYLHTNVIYYLIANLSLQDVINRRKSVDDLEVHRNTRKFYSRMLMDSLIFY